MSAQHVNSIGFLDLLIIIPNDRIQLTEKALNDINDKFCSFRSNYHISLEKWKLENAKQFRDYAGVSGLFSQIYLARRLIRGSQISERFYVYLILVNFSTRQFSRIYIFCANHMLFFSISQFHDIFTKLAINSSFSFFSNQLSNNLVFINSMILPNMTGLHPFYFIFIFHCHCECLHNKMNNYCCHR